MATRPARSTQFCRLCLKELDLVYMFSNDALTRMILFNNFPNMNLGRTNFIRLCKECYTNLDFVMTVKNGFPVKRRDFLRQKLSRVKDVKFCAFCLVFETCAQEVSIFLDDSYGGDSRVRKTVEGAISDFKFTDESTNICNFCWSWIWKVYNFMQQCNRIENILKVYCDENRLTSLTDTDIMMLLKLNVHIRDLRENIEKDRQNSIDLSQKEFQSYISNAKENYSKLVVALETNTDYVRMNLDIIRHMEYYFATGEVYPNLKDEAKNKDSTQSTETTTINRHNFVKPYDENGCYAYNINPMALQDSNIDIQNCIPSINLNDSDDEEVLVNKDSDDVIFVDNDNTFFGDENKNMKLDIDETDLKLQLCDQDNDTDAAKNQDNNNDSLEDIGATDFNLEPNYLETDMQMEKIGLEIEESKAASKQEPEYNIENDISTFQINAEILTDLIDNNSPKEYLTFEPSSPVCDNTDTVKELPEEIEFGKLSDDMQTTDAPAYVMDDDCYEVAMDTSKPMDLTTRPTDDSQMPNYNSNRRDCWGCYVCAAKFRSRRAVVRHTLIHERPWNKFGKFCCRFCPYRANWKGSVTRHENVHAFQNLHAFNRRSTKYLCIFCNVVFRVKGDVQSHMIKHIITWKHFQCLICMFAGNSSEALRFHYRNCHNEKAETRSLPITN